MKKVNEIFYSIQGEGYFTGTAAVFIRFSGCNMKCSFCDTKHQEGIMMSDVDILKEVLKYPARHVVVTGGEPGLQVTSELVDQLQKQGRFVQIETNGTVVLPDNIDWVTCSPKLEYDVLLKHIDELKIVYVGQELSQYDHLQAKVFCLQPCSGENTEEVIEYIKCNPRWRLSLQTHAMLGIQ